MSSPVAVRRLPSPATPRPPRARTGRLLAALALLLACGGGGDAPTDPPPPPPPPPGGGSGPTNAVATVVVAPAGPSVAVGGSVTLAATARNAAGEPVPGVAFAWTTDRAGVAAVGATSGVVTGIAPGTATVTAAGGGKAASTTVTVTAPPVASLAGAIAYARGPEIRAIEADGTGDRPLWSAPGAEHGHTVSGVVWRPDGVELAFSSDHEQAVSPYQRDVYAVRADGSGLRKLTNAPTHDRLASYPQGTVTVRVRNLTADAGPYVVHVQGAREPQSTLVAPGATVTLTFANVADFGEGIQPVVAISGAFRWLDVAAAPDVRGGAAVDGGTLTLTSAGAFQSYGAVAPGWRADGARIAFLNALTCIIQAASANPEPGFSFDPLLPSDLVAPCAYDWSPPAAGAHRLLVLDVDFDAGEGRIHRVAEGATSLGAPLTTFPSYEIVTDLRWLPDGSGFLYARTDALEHEGANLYEFTFATGATRQITSFDREKVRAFSIAPDGQTIAFERAAALDGPADLWLVRRDGTGLRLLVRDAAAPAWHPTPR